MSQKVITGLSLSFGMALVFSGCVPEDDGQNPFATGITYTSGGTDGGDGDGDADTEDPTGDGDGDGDPTTGDGDADPTTGDGDGDPTTGDGDGDPGCDGESPYMGGWDIGCCQDQVVSNGWQPGAGVGAVIPDWTFTDQHGDAVRVYDFCHEAMYFEYVALW